MCYFQSSACHTNINWNVTLHELDKFIGLIITERVLGKRGLPCSSLWNTS